MKMKIYNNDGMEIVEIELCEVDPGVTHAEYVGFKMKEGVRITTRVSFESLTRDLEDFLCDPEKH